jgi:hypothetical protein
MTRSKFLLSLVCTGTLAGAILYGAEETKKAATSDTSAHALFERLKGLEGEWETAAPNKLVPKGQVLLQYRLTGGGTALTELIAPGSPKEMLSVYHQDGEQLVMTHYCCMGNQPKMRAKAGKDKQEIVFEFTGGTNLDPEKDGHIHGGRIRIVDADHLHVEWDFYVGGKLADTHSADLVRKKRDSK